MRDTDSTRAGPRPCVVPDADLDPAIFINARINDVPDFGLVPFQRASKRERAQVRHLNHGRQAAVHEKRRLDDIWDLPIEGPFFVEPPAQLMKPGRYRVVVVVDNDPRIPHAAEVRLVSSQHLFEGHLIGTASTDLKVSLRDRLRKNPYAIPLRELGRQVLKACQALVPG